MKPLFKNKVFVIVLAALVVFGAWKVFSGVFQHGAHSEQAATIYYCPMHPTYTSDRPGDCPICNMKLVAKTVDEHDHDAKATTQGDLKEFTVAELVNMPSDEICLLHKCKMGKCVMVMTEEFARLGKCPHCGEDLGVIIKDLVPTGYANVRLPADKQALVGIKTALVTKGAAAKTIRTVGRIASDPELYQAEEELIQAVAAAEKAQASGIPQIAEQATKLVESARLRLKLLGLSEELIREVETTRAADRSLLYSEAGGKAWLYAPIYEYEMALVKIGDTLEAEVSAVPGEKFNGVIRAIDPVLDPVTRSVRVRAQLDNAKGLLKPEMYASATLKVSLGEALTVPEEAVFSTGERDIVFVVKPENVFEPREVVLGAKLSGRYEIKNGLGEGETVVTSGNFLIDSESRLKGALESMGANGGHKHGG